MVMVIEASFADGRGVANALQMTASQWLALQASYQVGELLMPCCSAPAIPKISPNGFPFFAHAGGACSTSEESQWHLAAKLLVRSELQNLGCQAALEVPGHGSGGKWQADVWAERSGVKLAVEIQRSYQSLRDYRRRQERYRSEGVRALWLMRSDRYLTLVKSMGKERLRTEFGGRFPPEGFYPCLKDVPVAQLQLEPTVGVGGAGFFSATVPQLLEACLTDRFLCIDGRWCIDSQDSTSLADKHAIDPATAAVQTVTGPRTSS
ncbi:competence protein CoiA [Pseudomonas sp. CK-NBRI-02]|uniref:competence protein CoiA n=1 Tax=Pseudomonas sp. CK-NBRI-02 TaxID=2249759 RepID=UPI00039E2F51|nr:competence protein CoiA family protein [Pseudomonas sp. CK-NBRI-02]